MAIVAACGVTIGGVINALALDDAIPDLDAGIEGSVNNWLTVVGSAIAAFAAAGHAYVVPARRRWFIALAAIFAFLSLDDLTQIHERTASNLQGRLDFLPGAIADHIEIVIFAPIFALALVLAWAVAREVPARPGRLLQAGLILLVAAVVVDLGATATEELKQDGTEWPHETRIAFEEGLEVSGWIIVSGALTSLAFVALLEARPSARAQQPTDR